MSGLRERLDGAVPALKLGLFLALLAPLGRWIWLAGSDALGADPVDYLTHASGEWALYCLFATLAMTPLRHLLSWGGPVRLRRMLGLYAFFYASVHLSIYALLDLGLDLSHLLNDIIKRPYISVGFAAWLLMLPLTITSTRGMMRRLGRRWQALHKLVYLCAALACLHYWWLVKADWRWPAFFAVLYFILMLARWRPQRQARRDARADTATQPNS